MNQAILYLRVSRDEQVRGTSLDSQEASARELCARVGYAVAACHREEGESGAHYHARPQLQAALAAVEALRAADPTGSVALVFARLDRAARDVGVHQAIEARLRRCGAVQLYCDGTPGGEAPADEYARNIMRAGTQFDRAQIRARTMEAKKRRAMEGRQPSRTHAPMGYHIVQRADVYPGSVYGAADLGRYVVVQDEAVVVRDIWRRALSGESLRQIARALEAQGVPYRQRGSAWRADTIRTILRNPAYKGEATYGRKSHRKVEDGERIRTLTHARLPQEVVYVPCPAFVSAAEWDAVQERLRTNRRTMGAPGRRALLSGLLRCPECGRGLYMTRMTRAYYYTCDGGRQQPVTCSRRRWQGPALERLVVGVVGDLASSPAVVASVLRSAAVDGQRETADLRSLERALESARRGEAAAVRAEVEARAAGRDATVYVEMVDAATRRRVEAQEALAVAQTGPQKARSFDSGALIALCGQIAPALADEAIPASKRGDWLRRVVVAVEPFETGDGVADRRCNPLPGATVTLVSPDGVGRLVVRATLSGDSVMVGEVESG